MTIETLVLDIQAATVLSGAATTDAWFQEFPVPSDRTDLRRVILKNSAYILSQTATEKSQLFVCNVRPDGLGTKNRPIVFSRALRMVLATFGNTVGIPRTYKLYREGPLSSIFAYHYALSPARIHFRLDGQRMFLYAITDRTENYSRIDIPEQLFARATAGYEDALLAIWEEKDDGTFGSYGIEFHDFIGRTYGQHGISVKEWCANKLTDQQLKFVNAPLDRPIRLRGSAGTGKTQCMAIKCLKELFDADQRRAPIRAAFITHSSGVAHEVVEGIRW